MCVSVQWLRPVTPNVAQETIAPAATHQAQALHLPLFHVFEKFPAELPRSSRYLHPRSLTVRPSKFMVGKLLSYLGT